MLSSIWTSQRRRYSQLKNFNEAIMLPYYLVHSTWFGAKPQLNLVLAYISINVNLLCFPLCFGDLLEFGFHQKKKCSIFFLCRTFNNLSQTNQTKIHRDRWLSGIKIKLSSDMRTFVLGFQSNLRQFFL